ncbi:hypothetical protein [Mameliella sediminis]|uniref:hypothetical protein n=1 Tax=Mameliella sediminis TaxID=2836866 RepID=UPI001C46AFD0|nr:hypothetical protein [Mameliella sediminis]MBV7393262.1 hypothetical protein [Mameliella sediminis]
MPVKQLDCEPLPNIPGKDATAEQLAQAMHDLIIWALNRRLGELIAAGMTGDDLKYLHRIAKRFEKGTNKVSDWGWLQEHMPELEAVSIQYTRNCPKT